MANSGWTADPDEITVPPDAADSDPRIYIGPNDPNAVFYGQAASIVFYWDEFRAFMLSVEKLGPGVNSGEFHLWSFDNAIGELKQIMDIVHDADPPEDHTSVRWGQDDSLYEYTIKARQQIVIEASGEPNPTSNPVVQLGGAEQAYTGDFTPDVQGMGGNSLPRGIKESVTSGANSAAIGAVETVIMTVPSRTYYAGRVYEMKVTGQQNISVATVLSQWRIRKTNAAGQVLADYGRTEGNGTNLNAHGINLSNRLFWVDETGDVTAALVLTLVAAGGTSIMAATAATIRKVEIFDAGALSNYPDVTDEPELV